MITYNPPNTFGRSARCNSTIPKFNFSGKMLPCQLPLGLGRLGSALELGGMNGLLLKKIEELTLYTLEQQMTIQYLIKEIKILKK